MECECCKKPFPQCEGCNGKDEFGCDYWRKRCGNKKDGCIPCGKRPPSKPPKPFDIKDIFGDSDTLLIAALIFVLYREKCDMKLLLALGYILLF